MLHSTQLQKDPQQHEKLLQVFENIPLQVKLNCRNVISPERMPVGSYKEPLIPAGAADVAGSHH